MEKGVRKRKGGAGGIYGLAISANEQARRSFLDCCRASRIAGLPA